MSEELAGAHEVMRRHAHSFSWAATLLPRASRDEAALLYALCRLIDDLADELPPAEGGPELQRVRAELVGEVPARPLVEDARQVLGPAGLLAALDLVDAVERDLEPARVADDAELLRYAYGVAGTVGLMMCPVLGVRTAEARPFALDLGIAMQLTNICRDVREDAERGRIYLPARRLANVGVAPETLLDGTADRDAVARVVADLLDLADRYYDSARRGFRYIPWRPRLAIAVAARVYRAIGQRLRERGCDALAGRAVVGLPGKVVETVKAVTETVAARGTGGAHDPALHRALIGLRGVEA